MGETKNIELNTIIWKVLSQIESEYNLEDGELGRFGATLIDEINELK